MARLKAVQHIKILVTRAPKPKCRADKRRRGEYSRNITTNGNPAAATCQNCLRMK